MNKTKGYIATATVLIVMVVVLAITASVSVLSIGEGQSSFSLTKGEETLYFLEGCAEDALLKVKTNSSYNGGNITRPEGTCTVSVSKAGNVWTLTVSTLAVDYKKTVEIVINRAGGISLVSWKEI